MPVNFHFLDSKNFEEHQPRIASFIKIKRLVLRVRMVKIFA